MYDVFLQSTLSWSQSLKIGKPHNYIVFNSAKFKVAYWTLPLLKDCTQQWTNWVPLGLKILKEIVCWRQQLSKTVHCISKTTIILQYMINKQYMHNVGKYQNYLYDLKKHLEKRAIMSCFTASAHEFDIYW